VGRHGLQSCRVRRPSLGSPALGVSLPCPSVVGIGSSCLYQSIDQTGCTNHRIIVESAEAAEQAWQEAGSFCLRVTRGQLASICPIRGRMRKKGSRGSKRGRRLACTSLLCQMEFVFLVARALESPKGEQSLYEVGF
jgi:hypothetical protein